MLWRKQRSRPDSMCSGLSDDDVDDRSVGSWQVRSADVLEDPDLLGVIIGTGDNGTRERLCREMRVAGCPLVTVIHPRAWVSPSARTSLGVFVGAHACVNAEAQIADGTLINTAAIVEHHVRIGPCAHIAPRAALGGRASVGALALVGIGATVLPRICVGCGAIVGAGAVAIRDVKEGDTVMGVPARTTEDAPTFSKT